MNSVQAETLARIIDKLEQEGCTKIKVEDFADIETHLILTLEFNIPAEPGEQPVERK